MMPPPTSTTEIDFWTPIVVFPSPTLPSIDGSKSKIPDLFAHIQRVDSYFSFDGIKAAPLVCTSPKAYEVITFDINNVAPDDTIHKKPTWLKVVQFISYFTGIIPLIMLIVKIALRNQYTFTHSPNSIFQRTFQITQSDDDDSSSMNYGNSANANSSRFPHSASSSASSSFPFSRPYEYGSTPISSFGQSPSHFPHQGFSSASSSFGHPYGHASFDPPYEYGYAPAPSFGQSPPHFSRQETFSESRFSSPTSKEDSSSVRNLMYSMQEYGDAVEHLTNMLSPESQQKIKTILSNPPTQTQNLSENDLESLINSTCDQISNATKNPDEHQTIEQIKQNVRETIKLSYKLMTMTLINPELLASMAPSSL